MSRGFRMPRGSDGTPLSALGAAAVAAIIATAVVIATIVIPFLSSKRGDSPAGVSAAQASNDPGAFDAEIGRGLARITGRSLFAIPGPPSDRADRGPRPATYSGPALLYIVNDTAVFSDGARVSPGSPNAKSLRLLGLRPPWSARVEWQGGEFDVELFKHVPLASLRDSLGKPTPAPSVDDAEDSSAGRAKPVKGPPIPAAASPGVPPSDEHEADAESDLDKDAETPAPAEPAPAGTSPTKPPPKSPQPPGSQPRGMGHLFHTSSEHA